MCDLLVLMKWGLLLICLFLIDLCILLVYDSIHMVNNILFGLFTSESRAKIFELLFNGENPDYYLRELARLSGISIRAIQNEIHHLCLLDLLVMRKDGNRNYYQANSNHPIYSDLVSLVKKTSGIIFELEEIFKDSKVEVAGVFGSFGTKKEKGSSDIDLLVIGDLSLRRFSKMIQGLEERFGREINPHIYTKLEFGSKIKDQNHFVSSILKEDLRFLKGDLSEFR